MAFQSLLRGISTLGAVRQTLIVVEFGGRRIHPTVATARARKKGDRSGDTVALNVTTSAPGEARYGRTTTRQQRGQLRIVLPQP